LFRTGLSVKSHRDHQQETCKKTGSKDFREHF
jgi:hypothetical protein